MTRRLRKRSRVIWRSLLPDPRRLRRGRRSRLRTPMSTAIRASAGTEGAGASWLLRRFFIRVRNRESSTSDATHVLARETHIRRKTALWPHMLAKTLSGRPNRPQRRDGPPCGAPGGWHAHYHASRRSDEPVPGVRNDIRADPQSIFSAPSFRPGESQAGFVVMKRPPTGESAPPHCGAEAT